MSEKRRKSVWLVIVNNELGMDEEEIQIKLKEYEKLKLNPAESEENWYVLEWGERLYIQCSGELREEILQRMLYFNHVMEKIDVTDNKKEIKKAYERELKGIGGAGTMQMPLGGEHGSREKTDIMEASLTALSGIDEKKKKGIRKRNRYRKNRKLTGCLII